MEGSEGRLRFSFLKALSCSLQLFGFCPKCIANFEPNFRTMCKGLIEVGLYMMVILQSDAVMPLQKKKKGNIMTVYKRVPVKPQPVENMMEIQRFCLFDVLTWWMLQWRCAHHSTHIWNFTLSPHVHMDKPFGTILEIMSIHTTHTHTQHVPLPFTYFGHAPAVVKRKHMVCSDWLFSYRKHDEWDRETWRLSLWRCFSFTGFFFCLF